MVHTTTLEEEILAQVKIDMDYWSQGDTVSYGKSAANDVTFFNNNPAGGRIDGAQAFRELLESWKGLIPQHEYKMVDPNLQLYGDIGIFTMHYHASLQDNVLLKVRGTCVYRKAGDSWELVHEHFSNFE